MSCHLSVQQTTMHSSIGPRSLFSTPCCCAPYPPSSALVVDEPLVGVSSPVVVGLLGRRRPGHQDRRGHLRGPGSLTEGGQPPHDHLATSSTGRMWSDAQRPLRTGILHRDCARGVRAVHPHGRQCQPSRVHTHSNGRGDSSNRLLIEANIHGSCGVRDRARHFLSGQG